MLDDTKQAGANLSIRREADPVAVAAERLADRCDDADFAAAFVKSPPLGSRRGVLLRDGAQ